MLLNVSFNVLFTYFVKICLKSFLFNILKLVLFIACVTLDKWCSHEISLISNINYAETMSFTDMQYVMSWLETQKIYFIAIVFYCLLLPHFRITKFLISVIYNTLFNIWNWQGDGALFNTTDFAQCYSMYNDTQEMNVS